VKVKVFVVSPGAKVRLADGEEWPLLVVYINCTFPPGLLGATWKVAVYVTVSAVPQAIPAIEVGLTAIAILMTLKGVGEAVVGVELDPLLPLALPHAAKLIRQMNTMTSTERFNSLFSIGCLNISFLLRTYLRIVQE